MELLWYQWLIITCLLVLPILYELNPKFKYNAKMALYYSFYLIASVLFLPIAIWRPRSTENFRLFQYALHIVQKLFGISVDVVNQEVLDTTDCNYVMVINHQSSLDILGLALIFPQRCTVMAKKELMYYGPLGLILWLCGVIVVDRSKGGDRLVKTVADHLTKNKLSLVVFPEGTRNHDGSIIDFKKGAFNIAVQAQLPIVPVVFSSYSDFYDKQEHKFNTGKFTITCLQRISTKGLSREHVPELTEKVRQRMLDVYNQSSLEATQAKLASSVS